MIKNQNKQKLNSSSEEVKQELARIADSIVDEWATIEQIPFYNIYLISKKSDPKHFAIATEQDGVLTPFELDAHSEPSNGLVILSHDGKFGILSIHQDLTYIKPVYDEIYPCSVGEHLIAVKDGIEGYVTIAGEFVSKADFETMPDEQSDEILEKLIVAEDI